MRAKNERSMKWTIASYILFGGVSRAITVESNRADIAAAAHSGVASYQAHATTLAISADVAFLLTWLAILVVYAVDNRDDGQDKFDGAVDGFWRWVIYFIPGYAIGFATVISFAYAGYEFSGQADVLIANAAIWGWVLATYWYRRLRYFSPSDASIVTA